MKRRMYIFVLYSLSGIQKGIQAGHCVEQYAHIFGDSFDYLLYIDNDKTWIILNGGTTRDTDNGDGLGSMNEIRNSLEENQIVFSEFREPDLNHSLTAICFLCDERVFDRTTYPDFREYVALKEFWNPLSIVTKEEIQEMDYETLKQLYSGYYDQWLGEIGGESNAFLRDLLKDKRLA